MKKLLIITTIIISILIINKEDQVIIPDEAIRFRVIAESNTKEDQEIKKKIVYNLQDTISSVEHDNLEDTRLEIKKKIPEFKKIVNNTLKENNLNKEFNINYGLNYFPEKEYKKVIYPEGEYESLVITLGEGKGNNFWCVLFPPLCLIDEDQPNNYKSFVKELIDKYF